MRLSPSLVQEALKVTALDAAVPRTPVDEDRLSDRLVAEFVAESESLEGHDIGAVDVLNSVRDLTLE